MADAKAQPNYMVIGMAGLVALVGSGVLLREAARQNQTLDRTLAAQPVDADEMTSEWMEKIRRQMGDIRS